MAGDGATKCALFCIMRGEVTDYHVKNCRKPLPDKALREKSTWSFDTIRGTWYFSVF